MISQPTPPDLDGAQRLFEMLSQGQHGLSERLRRRRLVADPLHWSVTTQAAPIHVASLGSAGAERRVH
ncbi:hypothetical protein Esti_004979 [Eimeria stiedai]